MKKKAIITGASGFLGNTLFKYAKEKYDVFPAHNQHALKAATNTIKLDITNKDEVNMVIKMIEPDIIFHLAAISLPNQCAQNQELSHEVNIIGTKNIVEAASHIGAKVIFTSSDLVFDGKNAPYHESSETSPISLYGEQKVGSEHLVRDYKLGCVCRMPLMFGLKAPYFGSFLQPMVQFLRANQTINLFENEIRTPISADRAAEGLLLMADKMPEVVHLSGDEAINRYDFGVMLSKLINTSEKLLNRCSSHDFSFAAPRPENTAMQNDFAKKLGFIPGNLEEELKKVISKM